MKLPRRKLLSGDVVLASGYCILKVDSTREGVFVNGDDVCLIVAVGTEQPWSLLVLTSQERLVGWTCEYMVQRKLRAKRS